MDDVIRHGSLLSHSMFSLESALGFLSKSVHGTGGFSKQYAKSNKKYSLKIFNRLLKIEAISDQSIDN